MRFLTRILAIGCGLALGIGIISWVADVQLLQPTAVIAHVPSGTYSQLATQLPASLAKVTAISPDQQALLAQFIDPAFLRQLVNNVVTTELNYWHGKTGPPTIDLRPLADRIDLAQADLAPQVQTLLDKPIPLANPHVDDGLQSVVHSVDRWRWLGLLIALVLAIAVWFTAGHRRLRYLAEALFVAALVIGGAILLGLGAPALINAGLATSPVAPLAPPIHAALASLVRASNHTLEELAAAMLGGAVVLLICNTFLGHRHHA